MQKASKQMKRLNDGRWIFFYILYILHFRTICRRNPEKRHRGRVVKAADSNAREFIPKLRRICYRKMRRFESCRCRTLFCPLYPYIMLLLSVPCLLVQLLGQSDWYLLRYQSVVIRYMYVYTCRSRSSGRCLLRMRAGRSTAMLTLVHFHVIPSYMYI